MKKCIYDKIDFYCSSMMCNKNLTMNSEHIHYKSWTSVISKDTKELCECCNERKLVDSCNTCGEGVCFHDTCCTLFPHYKNTLYIICVTCQQRIEHKLKVEIDYSKLRILKQKIQRSLSK